MRILGVDPGTLVVGYGCLDLQGGFGLGTGAAAGVVSRARAAGDTPMAHRVANLAQGHATSEVRMVRAGVLRLGRSGDELPARLGRLADQLSELLAELRPDEIALEEAYFGKSVQSALRIGESRGVVLAEAGRAGLPVRQFPPARIKRSVTGRGAANKELVARMVCQTLDLPRVPRPADITDALAVGLCWVEARRSFRLGTG